MAKLGDYVTAAKGKNKDGGCIDVYSVTNSQGFIPSTEFFSKEVFSKELRTYKLVNRGMIAYNPSRINVGSIALQDKIDQAIVSPLYVVFAVDETRLLPGYVVKFLKSAPGLNQVEFRSTGTVRNNLKFDALCQIELTIPSLEIQRERLSRLNSIERQIISIDASIAGLDSLVKSRFVEMFDSCEIQVRLGSVCRFQSGCTLPKEKEQASGEFLYAKVGDLNLSGNERIIVRSRTYVDAKTAQKCLVPKGSVVFPKRGGAIGTNKKRITGEACCLDLNLIAVIPSNAILVEYLLVWFDQMNLSDISNGSTVPQINNKDLDPLIIPLPFLELQQEFADFVARADKLRQAA